jgi:hypothetical protein
MGFPSNGARSIKGFLFRILSRYRTITSSYSLLQTGNQYGRCSCKIYLARSGDTRLMLTTLSMTLKKKPGRGLEESDKYRLSLLMLCGDPTPIRSYAFFFFSAHPIVPGDLPWIFLVPRALVGRNWFPLTLV